MTEIRSAFLFDCSNAHAAPTTALQLQNPRPPSTTFTLISPSAGRDDQPYPLWLSLRYLPHYANRVSTFTDVSFSLGAPFIMSNLPVEPVFQRTFPNALSRGEFTNRRSNPFRGTPAGNRRRVASPFSRTQRTTGVAQDRSGPRAK